MDKFLTDNLNGEIQSKLTQFKEYAVLHPQLARVDMLLMRAIREPAGFAHVLVYGPSGVGKTTMIRQIAKRLNENVAEQLPGISNSLSYRNGSGPPMPLLLLETRPPDGGVFNRADYYRTALKLLGEPFYERRMLIDIDAEQTWEKKGRGRTKTAQFNDSPELRHALEEAMTKRGVRAVILDEAQHLMKIGTGASAGKLLDQLDWIKSMTNVTGVLHILIGTYELLNFRNLSGQASRRGLDIHFPRYLYQNEQDRQDFQAALLALLMQVPMNVDVKELMQHWLYFYERSIGCVGVLKDWLIRAVAAALHDGHDTLSLERLHEHTLTLAQCERMALDTTEGEQKLSYMESRREHLWHLLQIGMGSTSVPKAAVDLSKGDNDVVASPPKSDKPTSRAKRTRKKPVRNSDDEATFTTPDETSIEPAPKKKQTRKKTKLADSSISEAPLKTNIIGTPTLEEKTLDEKATQQEMPKTPQKSSRRVGQRKPKRDTVGLE
ncbi:ATPase (plasmid) [Trichormus variabilis ATCC 29413]|uniref:ATPase n=2 Tax=Anabaena variabilis TaxID=264691 RepID=Q3MCF0_TRIV2|nr:MULTISPECIES: ATP-binding protein [Nostocaceae]ABA20955.1 ATPase [Trichormus variabilis ATCC 29413]ABA21336.1 ATPase [Trichormus variabilis ATCC 29413]ABA24542.1 ATPase [Trichormus variabilis ATCC 29413]ABA24780.1 ATPase [Trichormus variabilis ATCC 29413]ABA25277.1 ATPase [Trichormus variabilis ATCC 29413]